LSAHAELDVNVAMLDFAKRLPLKELNMVGTSVPRDEVEVVFPRVALQSDTGLRVLSLETGSSGSAWSFACRSARHIERHRAQSEHNDDSSSFGSLVGWGPTILAHKFDHPQRNTFYRPARRSTNDTMKVQRALAIDGAWGAGFGDTPMRSDAHYERTPSFTRRSFDSCDLFLQSIDLPAPAQNHEGMTDAEFEALPDWSDVEDDPEYNYSMKSSFCWSNTASSWS
ncbi:hypothetical protein BDW02DRAFT_483676, partial [Decorospora gaudefroyi]